MKLLVCVDGSTHSQHAIEKAALIAEGLNFDEISVIHVYDGRQDVPSFTIGSDGYVPDEQIERFIKLQQENEQERKIIVNDALKVFEEKGLKAQSILAEGHPANTIVKVAKEEKYDMIVMGSRGLGGLKKLFLGSVSNAVAQEAKDCTVIIVK